MRTFTDLNRKTHAHKETNDCAVKALAIACNVRYEDAHAVLTSLGRTPRDGTPTPMIYKAAEELGYKLVNIEGTLPKTVKSFSKKLDQMYFENAPEDVKGIIWVKGHVAGFRKDSVVDWTENRRHRVHWVSVAVPLNVERKPLEFITLKYKKKERKVTTKNVTRQTKKSDVDSPVKVIFNLCDQFVEDNGRLPTHKEMVALGVNAGVTRNTASAQYYRWKRSLKKQPV
jgi:hypothetical protein